jgi:hypothetical protein
MSRYELPALRGADPLGFLAALGAVRLACELLGHDIRLGWPDGPWNPAVIDCVIELDDLIEQLQSLAAHTATESLLVPGCSGFPPTKEGTGGSDPLKALSRRDARGYSQTAVLLEASGHGEMANWIRATLAMAAGEPDESTPTSPFLVWPTGQSTPARSMAAARDEAARPGVIAAGLRGWRRKKGFTGAYLDDRAIRDEFVGQHTSGQMQNQGEPGATWLGLMSMPWFPVVATERGVGAVGWVTRSRQPPTLRWPVWRNVLDPPTIRLLLCHPLVAMPDPRLGALSVMGIFEARRQPGPKGFGALGPGEQVWPKPDDA